MSIALLRIWNLRNYRETEFRPAAGTTMLTGENGSGKTSLLEAASLFSTLSSPRTGHMGALVREGEPEGGTRMETVEGMLLEVRIRGGRTLLRAGGVGVAAKGFLGRFRSVLFTPEDLDLVRGEPELRRRALDDLLIQFRPGYRAVRQEFERSLRQRNAALRHGREQDAALYDMPLATAGAQVLESRRRVVEELRPVAVELYTEMAGRGRLGLSYRDTSGDEGSVGSDLVDHLLGRYAETLQRDLERGRTGIGPHRDDLEVGIDGRPARTHASRGEQRSATLAFRLAELRLLPEAVLLLDDVLSELDPDRRRRVFEVTGSTQTVVTATDRDILPPAVKVDAWWHVDGGELHVA